MTIPLALVPRRQVSQAERLTPCQFCDYPLTQRHHAVAFKDHGENPYTLQLCANCHELYHLCVAAGRAATFPSSPSDATALLERWVAVFGADDPRFTKSLHFIKTATEISIGLYRARSEAIVRELTAEAP